MKNKKALSQVVSSVLLILITVSLVAGLWAVLDSFVTERLEDTEACYKLVDKIQLNNDWTCYNSSSNQMQFSIELKDADVKGVLVAISFEENSIVFTIQNESSLVENVSYFMQAPGEISLPFKEAAKTYVLDNVLEKPKEIVVAAISEKKQCDVSDFIDTIYSCS